MPMLDVIVMVGTRESQCRWVCEVIVLLPLSTYTSERFSIVKRHDCRSDGDSLHHFAVRSCTYPVRVLGFLSTENVRGGRGGS